MKLQRQHLKQYVKFIYTENAVRVVLLVALLWPPKIYFDRWFFYFSVYGDRQRNIYLQRWISGDDGKESRSFNAVHQNRAIAALISVFNRFWGGRSPANIYLFKFNNRNTRKKCEMCSKLTIKTPERHHWRSGVSIVNFERILHLFLVFLLLNLNKKMLPDEQWNKIDKNGLVFSWIRSSLNRSQWPHEPK